MSKRKWTNIKALEPEIIAMRKARKLAVKLRMEISFGYGVDSAQKFSLAVLHLLKNRFLLRGGRSS